MLPQFRLARPPLDGGSGLSGAARPRRRYLLAWPIGARPWPENVPVHVGRDASGREVGADVEAVTAGEPEIGCRRLDGQDHRCQQGAVKRSRIQQGDDVSLRDDDNVDVRDRSRMMKGEDVLILEDAIDLQRAREDILAVPVSLRHACAHILQLSRERRGTCYRSA